MSDPVERSVIEEQPCQVGGIREDGAGTGPLPESAAGERGARPGLPDPGSVVSVTEFTSRKGHRYRVLRTTEEDAYDAPDSPEAPPRRRRPRKGE